jgi:hypothetical protein
VVFVQAFPHTAEEDHAGSRRHVGYGQSPGAGVAVERAGRVGYRGALVSEVQGLGATQHACYQHICLLSGVTHLFQAGVQDIVRAPLQGGQGSDAVLEGCCGGQAL